MIDRTDGRGRLLRTEITPRLAAHQRVAVREIEKRLARRAGMILADEIGLGKSWVALAIAKEELRRGRAVNIVVPGALVPTWHQEASRFDLEVPITSHGKLRGLSALPGVVGAGLMIIDEAHRFRNRSTHQYQALCRLSVGRRLLLISATPFCNRISDLETLVSLIASDDALRLEGVSSISRAFAELDHRSLTIVRRELILSRSSEEVGIELPSIRPKSVIFSLGSEWVRICRAIEDLDFPLMEEKNGSRLAADLLRLRFVSSPEAFADSLRRFRRFYRKAREALRSGLKLTRSDYRKIYGDFDEGIPYQEILFPQIWLDSFEGGQDLERRIEEDLCRIESILQNGTCSSSDKLERLLVELTRSCDPAIVFTSSLATADVLYDAVRSSHAAGLVTSRRCVCRGAGASTREAVLAAFSSGKVDVLVMTDLGAEGLNMQAAGRVVHYDLPWNPARVDQRVGRARRLGQTRSVIESVLFLPREDSGRRVIEILREKARVWESWDRASSLPLRRVTIPASTEASRRCLPSRVGSREPQARLGRWLDTRGLLDEELGALLSARYRAGAEYVLRESDLGSTDRDRLESIREMLRKERSLMARS